MDFEALFAEKLAGLHTEGRYRVFAELERKQGDFPRAIRYTRDGTSESDRVVLQRLSRHGPASGRACRHA